MEKPQGSGEAYWRDTLGLLTTILIIWFIVPFGFGIILQPMLDSIHIGGYPLGFWFAQQGSIYVFLILTFWYASAMGKIDRKHDVHED